jgi:hypothetical protein
MEPADRGNSLIRRLFCGLLGRDYRYESSAEFRNESDAAVSERKQGMILAHADVHARVPFRSALADDDVAGDDGLVAEALDAEAPARGVTTVAG